MRGDLVLVGAIEGAFGVKGEVRVKPFTQTPEGVAAYGPLYNAHGQIVLTPESWRVVKDALAVTAPEVKTREEAEALRNTALHVPRARLPAPDEDEFYIVDLIGCRVEDAAGAALGEIVSVQNFGAGDVLEVRAPDGARFYLPFTKAAIPEIDMRARRVVADLPEAEG